MKFLVVQNDEIKMSAQKCALSHKIAKKLKDFTFKSFIRFKHDFNQNLLEAEEPLTPREIKNSSKFSNP